MKTDATLCIARRRESDGKGQPLIDHLTGVAARSKVNAAVFGGGDLAYVCGLVHDIGKYSAQFQRRINGADISVDHSTAGGQWLLKNEKNRKVAMLAAYCCMGHHGGLPNGGSTLDSVDDSTLYGREKKKVEDYSAFTHDFNKAPGIAPPKFQPKDGFSVAFYIRMLFSALVDADYIDTETFMREAEQARGGFADMQTLNHKLYKDIEKYLNPAKESNFLNAKRTELLKSCLAYAENPGGLFTLTAPTGSGKTKSGLAFAFKHAVLHGKRRVIYIAPYNTIIEQNATVFEEIFGKENVLRHYGNHHYDDKNEESSNKRLSAENWNFPMITTSSVQFLESLFAYRPSICRKLHNIANSVIIFDEAQMIPQPLLIPCVRAIAELASVYGCTILLATATQAKLDKYLGELSPIEIVDNPTELHNILKRNHIQVLENRIEDDELAVRLADHRQVLCIVNTRRHAQQLFEKVGEVCKDGVYHLSTTLYPAHRTRVLDEIRQRLEEKLPCRVISTSLIEAGVDADFPVVYRAEAGLDSIVQAAGRCNREGSRPASDSTVFVFKSEEHKPPASIKPNIAAAEEIMQNHDDLAAPEVITKYFGQLFYNQGEEALDAKKILSMLNDGYKSFSYPFRDVAEQFRIIEDTSKTVYVLYEVPELEERLTTGERTRELFRELAEYAVSLYETDIIKLGKIGALVRIKDKSSKQDDILAVSPEYYSEHFGVHLSPDGGKGIFID